MESYDKQVMMTFLEGHLVLLFNPENEENEKNPNNDEEQADKISEGYQFFEQFIPDIKNKIIEIIYVDTFGQVSGSDLMQATKMKTIMAKKYDHLREIIGDKRFEKYIDFPERVKYWREKRFSDEIIRKKLVESLMAMYLTAAKRDPTVFQVEILPVIREQIKHYLSIHHEELVNLDAISLDRIVRYLLKLLDVGRASIQSKQLMRDIQTYCMIIYFINQFKRMNFVIDNKDIIPILNNIRKEFAKLMQNIETIKDIRQKIEFSVQKIMKENWQMELKEIYEQKKKEELEQEHDLLSEEK